MKRRIKKSIALLLTLTLISTIIVVSFISVSAVIYDTGKFQYSVTGIEGTKEFEAEVVGYKGDITDSVIKIPSSIDYAEAESGKSSVIGIGYNAFKEMQNLTSVSIPETVETIGYGSFAKTGLKSFTVPSTVKSIGDFAFSDCVSLKTINFGKGVKSLGKYSFIGCNSLETVTLPSNITSIDDACFAQCENLNSVDLGSVNEIGDLIFDDCTSLSNVKYSSKLSSVGYMMFNGCTSLSSFTIPEGVTKIDFGAFKNCTNLKSISLPSTLKEIDYCVFEGCDNLSSITYNGISSAFSKIKVGNENGNFTTARVTYSSSKAATGINGDANADGKLNISDVTFTQKYIAKTNDEISSDADFNKDGKINITDATYMQKSIAKIT